VRNEDGQFVPPRIEVRDAGICRYSHEYGHHGTDDPLLLEACPRGARGVTDTDGFVQALKHSLVGVWDDRHRYYSEYQAIQWIGRAVKAIGHCDGEFQPPIHTARVVTTIPADLD
jgi:hypothetical protein